MLLCLGIPAFEGARCSGLVFREATRKPHVSLLARSRRSLDTGTGLGARHSHAQRDQLLHGQLPWFLGPDVFSLGFSRLFLGGLPFPFELPTKYKEA